MRYDKIDIPRSKEEGRIVRKKGLLDGGSDSLVYFAIVFAYPVLFGIALYKEIERGEIAVTTVLLFIAGLVVGGLLLYSVLNLGRLKRLKGLSKEENREIVKEIIERFGWKVRQDNRDMIIAGPKWRWGHWNGGRDVSIIYDRTDILINSTTYGNHDIRSPFHWFGNRKLEKMLTDEFESKLAKAHSALPQGSLGEVAQEPFGNDERKKAKVS
jgi:hypothetical protein